MIIKKYLSNVIEIKNFFKGDDLEKIHGRFKKINLGKKFFKNEKVIILMFLKVILFFFRQKKRSIYQVFIETKSYQKINLF